MRTNGVLASHLPIRISKYTSISYDCAPVSNLIPFAPFPSYTPPHTYDPHVENPAPTPITPTSLHPPSLLTSKPSSSHPFPFHPSNPPRRPRRHINRPTTRHHRPKQASQSADFPAAINPFRVLAQCRLLIRLRLPGVRRGCRWRCCCWAGWCEWCCVR